MELVTVTISICARAAVLIAALFALGTPAGVSANGQARRILEESAARHRAVSMEYAGEVITVSARGQTRRKAWRSYRQGHGGAANRLIRFLSPPEVRGVAFLQRGRAGATPDQWIYLPSMKRERRIAPQDRDAAFVGTDFSFEDLEELDLDRFDVELDADRTVEGHACHAIVLKPRDRSAYAKQLLVLRKDTLSALVSERYAPRAASPIKRLVFSDYRLVQGRWTALKLEMTDLRSGTRTTVILRDVLFDAPQPDDRFTLQNLTREGW